MCVPSLCVFLDFCSAHDTGVKNSIWNAAQFVKGKVCHYLYQGTNNTDLERALAMSEQHYTNFSRKAAFGT